MVGHGCVVFSGPGTPSRIGADRLHACQALTGGVPLTANRKRKVHGRTDRALAQPFSFGAGRGCRRVQGTSGWTGRGWWQRWWVAGGPIQSIGGTTTDAKSWHLPPDEQIFKKEVVDLSVGEGVRTSCAAIASVSAGHCATQYVDSVRNSERLGLVIPAFRRLPQQVTCRLSGTVYWHMLYSYSRVFSVHVVGSWKMKGGAGSAICMGKSHTDLGRAV